MSGIFSGVGTRVQLGHETEWGTAVPPVVALNHQSESLKPTRTKSEEKSLTGPKTALMMDTTKVAAAGDVPIMAKPDGIGDVLYLAMGSEAADPVGTALAGYLHTLVLVPSGLGNSLPSATLHVDRHVAKKNYPGGKVSSLKISGRGGDRISITPSFVARCELESDDAGFQDLIDILSLPSKKALRFADGRLGIDGDENTYCKVRSFDVTLSNNLDGGDQTFCSGLHTTEPQPQRRSITVNLDAEYNPDFEALRKAKYVGDATASLVLTFTSSENIPGTTPAVPYVLTITLPAVMPTEANANASGEDKLRIPFNWTALSQNSAGAQVEPITITLLDDVATKYKDRT